MCTFLLDLTQVYGCSRDANRQEQLQAHSLNIWPDIFKGTWCSGITPAQHAGGPGFNPQRVHGGVQGDLLARSERCDLWHGLSKSK